MSIQADKKLFIKKKIRLKIFLSAKSIIKDNRTTCTGFGEEKILN